MKITKELEKIHKQRKANNHSETNKVLELYKDLISKGYGKKNYNIMTLNESLRYNIKPSE